MKTLLLILGLLLMADIRATHIVGGEIMYKYLSNNNYEIKLLLYIDCFNGSSAAIAQDQFANFAVFEGDSGNHLPVLCQSVLRNSPVRVSKTNYNCIKISPNACVDAYEYVTTMHLPPIKGGYYLSWQRCCRNNTIINLVNPMSTGDNIWTKISDTTGVGYNSSPVFNNLPPNFLCTNAPLVFDHSATDADGDSLSYEFFHPYAAATAPNPRPECYDYQQPPFDQVVFETSYSKDLAIPSSPTINLNPLSGMLQLTPTLQGQFVVGIMVSEYRKGKLIGHTRRDYQFNVQNCVFQTTSAFATPSVNCNREVFFINNSQNADTYFWEYGDSSTLADTSSLMTGYYRYPTPGTYLVKLLAAKGNCMDSIKKLVTVFDRIEFKLPDDFILCNLTDVLLFPDTFYQNAAYLWNTGSTDSTVQVNAGGMYWLNIQLGNCNTSDSVNLIYDDQRVELLPDSLRCNPETGELEALLQVNGAFKDISWKSDPDQVPPLYNDSFLQIKEKGYFFIKGIKKNGCPYSDSLQIESSDLARLLLPYNVFTPNTDGINDVFPEALPSYRYKLSIFNRWGIEVFHEENIPWNAVDFPEGTYYYFIVMEACEAKNEVHGVVRVIR